MFDSKGQYQEAVQRDGSEHTHGAPDIAEFLAMVKSLYEADIGEVNKKFLRGLSEEIKAMGGPISLSEVVKICAVKDAGAEGKIKITLFCAKEAWRHGLLLCFKNVMGFDYKPGRPPPSGLEDDICKWLEALKV